MVKLPLVPRSTVISTRNSLYSSPGEVYNNRLYIHGYLSVVYSDWTAFTLPYILSSCFTVWCVCVVDEATGYTSLLFFPLSFTIE